ncbi:Gfo/Idh/MocA family oxidoreductase [Cellulomonas humilata]|uniref:Gfo/Idh/MocA family oxidoreductase n=1 Tax=Cellulomonas humilata TaxID=144055 RepID=A0A7Y6DX10_9CELL|nr:Gfo/Idh/MocA family oxidoreductase [Cellulomonas humilata]
MIRVGIVGLGKMGLSHLAMFNAHPDVTVAGVCDTSSYVLSVLGKNTGLTTYTDYDTMLEKAKLDAVVICTPSVMHGAQVSAALDRGLHVFCEKPFCLDPAESDALAQRAEKLGLVTQVGYHYRFVGAFEEVRRLLDAGAIGTVTHVLAEAYGPVVLKPKGGTWRSQRTEGGGCLYDYAAHPLNLLTWYFGVPTGVSGSVLGRVFSQETDDEVTSTLHLPGGATASLSVSWSDDSQRKMTTKLTLWGTHGRIFVDRQEVQVYLRDTAEVPPGYEQGWNVRYTTDLTEPVWFYVRGEEYSSQVDAFVQRVVTGTTKGENTFRSAADTDLVIAAIVADAEKAPTPVGGAHPAVRKAPAPPARTGLRRLLPQR